MAMPSDGLDGIGRRWPRALSRIRHGGGRELIIERTHEGLRTAWSNGKKSGRKPKLSERQQAEVRRMHAAGQSIVYIADVMQVSRPVIYRVLEAAPAG